MQIKQDFIPLGQTNRPGYQMTPQYITVHNTANTSIGANAIMHSRYVKNPTTAASWHFTVDDGDVIYQHLPTNENGWHAGDGLNGKGNRQSIGIEICENEGINEDKANKNAVWLISRLMKEYKISISNVVPHQKWSGKNCPRKILPIWTSFIERIKTAQVPGIKVIRIGDRGAPVTQLQIDLNSLGYKLVIDGSFGPATEAAIKAFQNVHKLLVDGVVGPETLTKIKEVIQLNNQPTNELASPIHQKAQEFVMVNGISDGSNPKQTATREQVWTMLERMFNILKTEG